VTLAARRRQALGGAYTLQRELVVQKCHDLAQCPLRRLARQRLWQGGEDVDLVGGAIDVEGEAGGAEVRGEGLAFVIEKL
jgi:hypothetical protein